MLNRLLSWKLVLIWLLLFPLPLWAAEESQLITLIAPSSAAVREAHQVVEGMVDEPFITRLSLLVEPFITEKEVEPIIVRVEEGRFREEVALEPGLNIITVSTLGGQHKVSQPIFWVTTKEKGKEKIGSNTPIIFVEPAGIKLSAFPTLKGVVTDTSITSLQVVTLGFYESLLLTGEVKGEVKSSNGNIRCSEVGVKDMTFSLPLTLSEGLNMVIARPAHRPAGLATIQMKVLVYERPSEMLVLEEPKVVDGRVIIVGKATDPAIKEVTITASALVSVKDGEAIKTLFRKKVKVGRGGKFRLKTGWGEDYTIKSSPTIAVTAGKERATKTLIKWW
ncbi:MAG: hypothetical protein QME81_03570 [bacterium]|nr:hypothetical protein [bacterium]